MRGIRHFSAALGVALIGAAPAFGWSLLNEVTVFDPGLTASMVWEIPNAKTYCDSLPANLDRLACTLLDPDEFWIGLDGAGNQYGTLNAADSNGTYFEVYRRPSGTAFSPRIIRFTKRVEPVFGMVTKLFAAGRWEVDTANGALLIGLRGQCLSSACAASGDTSEHLGLLRISGLPALYLIASTFEPAGTLSFRVPALPEALPTGERFDVFVGDVASLPDLSTAQPYACDVAAGRLPGEEVQILDTLPDPAPRRARYYLTAVSSGALRRAGRQSNGGMLSGRDADFLPACL